MVLKLQVHKPHLQRQWLESRAGGTAPGSGFFLRLLQFTTKAKLVQDHGQRHQPRLPPTLLPTEEAK